MYNAYCIPYTACCILCCILHTAYRILHTAVDCILCCILHIAYRILHTAVDCILCCILCRLHTLYKVVYNAYCIYDFFFSFLILRRMGNNKAWATTLPRTYEYQIHGVCQFNPTLLFATAAHAKATWRVSMSTRPDPERYSAYIGYCMLHIVLDTACCMLYWILHVAYCIGYCMLHIVLDTACCILYWILHVHIVYCIRVGPS